MEVPIVIGMVAVFILLAGFAISRENKRLQLWKETAERLALRYGNSEISGTLSGISIRVVTETRGSGKNKSTYTLFLAALDDQVPSGLSISRENIFRKIGKVIGMQDIQLDLPGIDEKLMVRADDEAEVRRWAQRSDVSRGLIDLIALDASFLVSARELSFEFSGAMNDGPRIELYIEKLVHIAKALSGKGYGALVDDGAW